MDCDGCRSQCSQTEAAGIIITDEAVTEWNPLVKQKPSIEE